MTAAAPARRPQAAPSAPVERWGILPPQVLAEANRLRSLAARRADLDGVGSVFTVVSACEGCNSAVDAIVIEGPTPADDRTAAPAPRLCPACRFREAVASEAVADSDGLLAVTPPTDPVAAEKARFRLDWPHMAAALDTANLMPQDRPTSQDGPLPWSSILARRGLPHDPTIPVRDGRFSRGDFGTVGDLKNADVTAAARFASILGSDLERNALTVEAGRGLLVARHPLPAADPNEPPSQQIEILGWLDTGAVHALARIIRL